MLLFFGQSYCILGGLALGERYQGSGSFKGVRALRLSGLRGFGDSGLRVSGLGFTVGRGLRVWAWGWRLKGLGD